MKRQAQGPLDVASSPDEMLKRLRRDLASAGASSQPEQQQQQDKDDKKDGLFALKMLLQQAQTQSTNNTSQQQQQQPANNLLMGGAFPGLNFDMLRSISSASSASNCSVATVQMPFMALPQKDQQMMFQSALPQQQPQVQQQQQQQAPVDFAKLVASLAQQQQQPQQQQQQQQQQQFLQFSQNNSAMSNPLSGFFSQMQQQPQQQQQTFGVNGLMQLAQITQQQQQQPMQMPFQFNMQPSLIPQQPQFAPAPAPASTTGSLVSKVALPSRRVRQKPSNLSKFRGVFRQKGSKPWAVRINVDGEVKEIGQFSSEVEAAIAHDRACIAHDLDRALLNFPESVALEDSSSSSKDGASSVDSVSEPGSPDSVTDSPVKLKRNMPSSSYRGVCWNKCNKSWKASIKVNGKNTHIGYFDNMHEAALAYDLKAIEVRGSRAVLNFQHPKLTAF